jgi:predicted nucleic acid-binding protein
MNGMTDERQAPLIYIDANPFIYAVEGNDALAGLVNALFARLRQYPGAAVTSELTLAEVLPKAPLPVHRRSYFNLLIWSGIFNLRPVSREILVETANYRRTVATKRPDGTQIMPKLPDSIHVVTAIRNGCKSFLSADTRIRIPVEMSLIEATETGIADLVRELS